MPYKILPLRKLPGAPEGIVVEVDQIDEFWEHQILAGNAVVISEPKAAPAAPEAPADDKPKADGKTKRGRGSKTDQDPED